MTAPVEVEYRVGYRPQEDTAANRYGCAGKGCRETPVGWTIFHDERGERGRLPHCRVHLPWMPGGVL